MQSKSSLSQEQLDALKPVYLYLKGSLPYLSAHRGVVRPEDEAHVASLLELGDLAHKQLLQHFPEILEWALGGGGK